MRKPAVFFATDMKTAWHVGGSLALRWFCRAYSSAVPDHSTFLIVPHEAQKTKSIFAHKGSGVLRQMAAVVGDGAGREGVQRG